MPRQVPGINMLPTYTSITKLKNGLWMGRITIGRKEDYKAINIKPKTYDVYEIQVNHNIIPSIGHIKLKELRQQDLQRFYFDI